MSAKWTAGKKQKLLNHFSELYPEPRSELNFKNDYQLIVSVILSAQCTDKKVNETTPALFQKYANFKQLSEANLAEVEQLIRPINYYKTKAKNLIEMAGQITKGFGGRLPRTFADLTGLKGVGQKTANVILSEKGFSHALPVDTHVHRVSNRLGLVNTNSPEKTESALVKQFPPESWRTLHHSLIFHGRRVCKAQNPDCKNCSLSQLCPASRQ